MPSAIKRPRDFTAGLLFTGIGIAFAWWSRDYALGTLRQMGPGFFPLVLGSLLAVIGLFKCAAALFGEGERFEPFSWRPLLLVAGASAAFALLIRGAGLV